MFLFAYSNDMRKPQILAVDAGGTMTDTFAVAQNGNFCIGKAQTTPHDESEGLMKSFDDALKSWGIKKEDAFPALSLCLYSGTTMLNKLLSRQGASPIGILTTAGFEDVLRFGRGVQSYVNYPYSERLHAVSHHHEEPLVPRKFIRGARERTHFLGFEIIPLYEEDVKNAVEYFVHHKVKAICVCFLYSYRNPSHEQKAETLIREILTKHKLHDVIPVTVSSRHNPVRGELPRLNTLVVEAYAAEPCRQGLMKIEKRLRDEKCRAPLRVLTSYGGTISPRQESLVSTLVSGPIGGLLGAKYLGETLGVKNMVCTDVGGTSFDVGLITNGNYTIKTEPAIEKFLLNIPTLALDSKGAGTGTYVRLDPVANRINLGPDSAGSRVGVSYKEGGADTPTITDCALLLGYVNPDYFLGGEIKLQLERAYHAVKTKISDPLKTDIYEAAWGVLKLLETQMRDYLYAQVMGLGYAPENYTLLSYGGGGPLHAAGYTEGLHFEDVLIPSWAAAFSAFGGACADFSIRFDESVDLLLTPDGANDELVASYLTQSFSKIKAHLHSEFSRSEISPESLVFYPSVRMQYRGMLDDIEVRAPSDALDVSHIKQLVADFNALFERIYARASKSEEMGYVVTKAIGQCVYPTEKPHLKQHKLHGKNPPENASKGKREIYWDGQWMTASLYEMDKLECGNAVQGPAVIEAPSTTLLVPPAHEVHLDKYQIFHLKKC